MTLSTPEPTPPQTSAGGGRIALLIGAVVVLIGALGFIGWKLATGLGDLGSGSGPGSNGSASDSSTPGARTSDTAAEDGKDGKRLTAGQAYGKDRVQRYDINGVKTTMLVEGRWDHPTCQGVAKTERGRKALQGCVYGVEHAMQNDRHEFWIGQRWLVYDSAAAARAAQTGLDKTLAQDIVFTRPEVNTRAILGARTAFGKCLTVTVLAADTTFLRSLDRTGFDALSQHMTSVLTEEQVEAPNAFRFGGHANVCG